MKIEIQDIWTIETPPPGSHPGYVGWPTLTRTSQGKLLAVYSGGRQHHICPFGQVHYIESVDQGKTWTWPRVLVDGPLDDRDAGILETSKGTLLVNWFTSIVWQHSLASFGNNSPSEKHQWELRLASLNKNISDKELGTWAIRSTDGGYTWSAKIDTIANSPHGPIELSDGSLLYPGKHKAGFQTSLYPEKTPANNRVGAARSTDDGQSWQWYGDIQPMEGHQVMGYHELHGVQAADGRIVVHIRNHETPHDGYVLQTHSLDGGKTWAPVTNTGIWGLPNFLIRTRSGLLITTGGHRREPFGNHVAVSEDHGQSWSPQMPVSADSVEYDMGYPSTVELEDNVFLTLWYDKLSDPYSYLRLSRWALK